MGNILFQNQPVQNNPMLDLISAVKSTRSPDAAFTMIANSGMKITLPNGHKVDIKQFANMMRGKTFEQACAEMGQNPSTIRRYI